MMGDVVQLEGRPPQGRAAQLFAHIETYAAADPDEARAALSCAASMATFAEGWPVWIVHREVQRLMRIVREAEGASKPAA
jgi:hypothetical protein